MGHAKKRTAKVEEVRPYLQGVAKNLVDKLYGPNGPAWGTQLTEIEGLCLALREVLTEGLLAEALARQAQAQPNAPPAYRQCSGCQQPLDCPATNERIVRTDAGEAVWAEPTGYCDRCRRSFFPSVQEPGGRPER